VSVHVGHEEAAVAVELEHPIDAVVHRGAVARLSRLDPQAPAHRLLLAAQIPSSLTAATIGAVAAVSVTPGRTGGLPRRMYLKSPPIEPSVSLRLVK